MSNTPDPSALSSAVRSMQAHAKICGVLMGGTDAMRCAGQTYLPQEPAESLEAWNARMQKTVLFPAYSRAIATLVGKPFQDPIAIGDDVPARVKECLDNVDQAGRDLDGFARDVFEKSIVHGIGWIVADYPRVPVGATLADERNLGVRPYLIHVSLDEVCGWRSDLVQGVHRLTQFRYKENVEIADGEFLQKVVQRIRVWNRSGIGVSVQVWEQNEKREWVLQSDDPVSIGEIPVATAYTGRNGFQQAVPPLVDLAWLNVEHWQSRSDQRHILHFARVPLLFGKNLTRPGGGETIIGPNRLINGPPDSDLKVVEHSGAAIEAGRTDLQDIELAMQRMAGEIVARVSGAKTATEVSAEADGGNSQLKKWIASFEDSLEEALRLMGLWIGETTGGELSIATEWDDDDLTADMIQALLNAQGSGNLSRDSVLWTFQRRGLLPPGRTIEMEKVLIDAEGPIGLGGPTKKSDSVQVVPAVAE